jgi:frataxin-like iron-binding protein CyaY
MEESEFEARSLQELHSIGELIESQTDSIDFESIDFHEGVLSIEFQNGTFVLNKHGASKQIWYSSPVSAPAYFEALTTSGKTWWSIKLQMDLRRKLRKDVFTLTGKELFLGT